MPLQLPPGNLYGETLRSHKTSSFNLSERAYPASFRTPRHSHKQALFCYVVEGDYTETYDGKTRECCSSALLFHPANETHTEHFHDAGGRSFIIEVTAEWLERAREYAETINYPSEFHGGALEMLARRVYKEFTLMDGVSSLVIEGLMLEMIGEIARYNANTQKTGSIRAPRWLQQAKELLHARFSERLTLGELARDVGVHPVHLAQAFHKSYKRTVGDYVRNLRIDYARRELAASETPIIQIALAAGFCDQSHFTRTFKRLVGIAPSQYRESMRNV